MEVGGLLRWEDYAKLSRIEKLTRLGQCQALEITAFTIEVSLRKGVAGDWAAVVCFEDGVMEGPFYLTKDVSGDIGIERRLQEERWLSIILGNHGLPDHSVVASVLVLEEDKHTGCWERLGLAEIKKSTLGPDRVGRQTITLQ